MRNKNTIVSLTWQARINLTMIQMSCSRQYPEQPRLEGKSFAFLTT